MHSFLSWIGLGLAALHGLILLGDSYTRFDLAQVVTPFVSDYRPIPVGLGIVGFYLMLLLSLSFYARPYISQRSFRLLHYAGFLAFAMVTLHGLLAGTDTGSLWWLYSLSLLSVLVLSALRVIRTRSAAGAR
jgi:predicted ferric reductase